MVFAKVPLYKLKRIHQQVQYKACLKRPLKIDKTKILKTNGSLMKVESIEECSLQYFLPALSDNRPWKPILVFFLIGRLRQILLYFSTWLSGTINKLLKGAEPQIQSQFYM